jgi:hypothetical protein
VEAGGDTGTDARADIDDAAVIAAMDRLLDRVVALRKPSAEVREPCGIYRFAGPVVRTATILRCDRAAGGVWP